MVLLGVAEVTVSDAVMCSEVCGDAVVGGVMLCVALPRWGVRRYGVLVRG